MYVIHKVSRPHDYMPFFVNEILRIWNRLEKYGKMYSDF